MINQTWEIDKNTYDMAMENGGKIPSDKELEVFGASICSGYGLYGNSVREKNGKYYLDFITGSSCD